MSLDEAAAGTLLQTALYDEHRRLGGRMVPFAGYDMPVQYAGIVEEHNAVRERAGMFDVSHMGRFEVHGQEAGHFLRYISTWEMTRLQPGEGHYSAACREDGGILDDIYVFCLEAERYLVVVNASNAPKMKAWMQDHVGKWNATFVDRHASTAMIAVQGPEALGRLEGVVGAEFVRSLKPRRCGEAEWRGQALFASRTGYTGEDGLELVIDAGAGPDLWRALLDAGVQAAGLGARDTLRLEAALLLYGNADFIGRNALVGLKERGISRELVCFKAAGRGIMRSHCDVFREAETVGTISSGGYSPTLGVSIGMGFVRPELAAEGTELKVDVRGKPLAARIVPRPFYKRPRPA